MKISITFSAEKLAFPRRESPTRVFEVSDAALYPIKQLDDAVLGFVRTCTIEAQEKFRKE